MAKQDNLIPEKEYLSKPNHSSKIEYSSREPTEIRISVPKSARPSTPSPLEIMGQDVNNLAKKVILKPAYDFTEGFTAEQITTFFNLNGGKITKTYLQTSNSIFRGLGYVSGLCLDFMGIVSYINGEDFGQVYCTTKLATNVGSLGASKLNKWYESAKTRAKAKPTETK